MRILEEVGLVEDFVVVGFEDFGGERSWYDSLEGERFGFGVCIVGFLGFFSFSRSHKLGERGRGFVLRNL